MVQLHRPETHLAEKQWLRLPADYQCIRDFQVAIQYTRGL